MSSQVIQWYPGHMAKTRRMIEENQKNVDIIIEVLDARIPYSSRNPEITKLTASKPSLILLNKASLADPVQTVKWMKLYSGASTTCVETDCITGNGLDRIALSVRRLCSDKLSKYEEKGMSGRKLKAMVLGIPNVGKSSLVNRLGGSRKAKVENRPGVTLDKQWISTAAGFDLLDMPGMLWPKFDDKRVGENLAVTGAVRDGVLDIEQIAMLLCKRLRKFYPELLEARYKLEGRRVYENMSDYELLCLIGKKRGFLVSGGEIDTDRTAHMLLDEFRMGRIGRITLDYIISDDITSQ